MESLESFEGKTVLVTGANSGLGYESAGQLAEAGFGRVILACRTFEKATTARESLVTRVGSDPFETLAVDVSSIESAEAASKELVERGVKIDLLLFNAGMVSGETMNKSVDGYELSFASSIIGHHILAIRLIEASALSQPARIVIVSSEAARGDLPAMMGLKLYDFATGSPEEFGSDLHDAMVSFAKGDRPELFSGSRYYAVTKLFSCWWAAAMARAFGERIAVFAVSPGSNLSTNAARHVTGFKRVLFTKVMPLLGPIIGMDQPVGLGAKRYLDVLNDTDGEFVSGRSYASKVKKLVGPLVEQTNPHILDIELQDEAFKVIGELSSAVVGRKV